MPAITQVKAQKPSLHFQKMLVKGFIEEEKKRITNQWAESRN
jgi:hypothetical protein